MELHLGFQICIINGIVFRIFVFHIYNSWDKNHWGSITIQKSEKKDNVK